MNESSSAALWHEPASSYDEMVQVASRVFHRD